MTTTPAGGRRIAAAALTGLLILVDGALTAIGLLVRSGQQRGNLSRTEAATFVLVGASAGVGMVILLLAMVALARGTRGHSLAKAASASAWLRTAGVIIALIAIAISRGIAAIAGLFESFGAAVALFDALIAVFATNVAERRTRFDQAQ
ncbi:hypothetical protein [Krasilnikovia sp. MM14-A1259]|uniref:hypothetical protein n=1 Tax=Krasilnikovia sp. MM14-A1259 TaxID=3373539 RepID=UPI0037FFFC92